MRVDIIPPDPMPRVSKVSESSSISTNYDEKQQQSKQDDTNSSVTDGVKKSNYQKLKNELESVEKDIQQLKNQIQYKLHKDPDEVIMQIVDQETGKVVEDIPSEKMLEMISTLQKLYEPGVDKKA